MSFDRPLRVAILSKADSAGGGASRVATDLTRWLNGAGHQAEHVVALSILPRPKHLWRHSGPISRLIWWFRARIERRTLGQQDLLPMELPGLLMGGVLRADVIHFHDVSMSFTPTTLRLLPRLKPTLWTFHDCSPFTGGCLYPMGCPRHAEGCGACPQLGQWPTDTRHDTTQSHRRAKRNIARAGRIHPITPSEWMADQALASGDWTVRPQVIANAVDTDFFRPAADRAAVRRDLGLDPDRPVVLVTAGDLFDERKGFPIAAQALFAVADLKPQLLLVGHTRPLVQQLLTPTFHVVTTGYITDAAKLAEIYGAADLFLFSSYADNQPLVVLETMAVGVATVGFATGGVPDLVAQGETGALVPTGDVRGLAEALRAALTGDRLPSWRHAARSRAVARFSPARFVAAHVAAYRAAIAESRQRAHRAA